MSLQARCRACRVLLVRAEFRLGSGRMYGTDQMRAEVLRAYIKGGAYNGEHDRYVIRELKTLGFPRCSINMDTEKETLRTTELGKKYLKTIEPQFSFKLHRMRRSTPPRS